MTELGAWNWYVGNDDDDDEMCECRDREAAIAQGLREHSPGDSFWVVEGRMTVADEEAMGAGERDTAPFAETRNGFWVSKLADGSASFEGQD